MQTWIAYALCFSFPIGLLGVAATQMASAARLEGWKLAALGVVPAPWIIEIVLGHTHQFGERRHGPGWVPAVIAFAAIANPVLWLIVLIWLRRAWRCVVPFVTVNVLVMPVATLVAGRDWAGACL